MYLNTVLISVVVGVVHVMAGCVEDPFKMHGFMGDKEAVDLKDVELISKDLKYKLDHGLNEKELMEKMLEVVRHHLLSEYQAAEKGMHHSAKESKIDEKNDYLIKALHGMLGPEFKKEEISEEELKAVVVFLKKLSAGKDEEILLKKGGTELHKDISSTKFEEDLLKFHTEKDKKSFDEKFKDAELHLAESLLHMQTDKDAKAYLHGDKEALEILKKLEEKKSPHPDGSVPYFLMGDEAKAYFKSVSERSKLSGEETKLKLDSEEEALKKLLSILKDSMHSEAALHGDKQIHKDEEIAKGISKPMGSMKTERAVADMKSLPAHKAHHKDGMITHEKDLIYDELLKKEEVHSLDEDEDMFHEYGKAFEDEKLKTLSSEESIKSYSASGEKSVLKASGIEKTKIDEEMFKTEKDKSIEDILKEDGYYITKGTHAYEKAREQAEKDAKVSLADEAKKKIAVSEEDHVYDHKFLNGEEGLKKEIYHGMEEKDHVYGHKFLNGEEGLKKDVHHGIDEKAMSDIDKYLHNTKTAFEETLKSGAAVGKEKGIAYDEDAWKVHDIGTGFAKGEDKFVYDSGVGFGEEKIKHGIKSDESHILHGVHSTDADHHAIGAEEDAGKSHNKAHGLKEKFLSVLGRVLNLRKCHLVTMRPGELLGIVDCISRSKYIYNIFKL